MSESKKTASQAHVVGSEGTEEKQFSSWFVAEFGLHGWYRLPEGTRRLLKKAFTAGSEISHPVVYAVGIREAARHEAVGLIERAGLEMEEEYDLLVDDLTETMMRFALTPSPQMMPLSPPTREEGVRGND